MVSIGKKCLISLTGAACLTLGMTQVSQAAVIDTISSWNGASSIFPFGERDIATYGQTFTVGSDNVLQNFSFRLGGTRSGADGVDFAAYVMAWDGLKATGPILYQSSQQTKAPDANFEAFAFNTGNINLVSGQQYVAFLSASNFFDGILGLTAMGFVNDVYAGGSFVYSNNRADFNLLTSSAWGGLDLGGDTAFTASFSSAATPIPTPALLPGLVGLGVAALRKGKESWGEEAAETAEV